MLYRLFNFLVNLEVQNSNLLLEDLVLLSELTDVY